MAYRVWILKWLRTLVFVFGAVSATPVFAQTPEAEPKSRRMHVVAYMQDVVASRLMEREGVTEWQEAELTAITTLVERWHRLGRFDEPCNFAQFRVALNNATLDELRHQAVVNKRLVPLDEAKQLEAQGIAPDALDDFEPERLEFELAKEGFDLRKAVRAGNIKLIDYLVLRHLSMAKKPPAKRTVKLVQFLQRHGVKLESTPSTEAAVRKARERAIVRSKQAVVESGLVELGYRKGTKQPAGSMSPGFLATSSTSEIDALIQRVSRRQQEADEAKAASDRTRQSAEKTKADSDLLRRAEEAMQRNEQSFVGRYLSGKLGGTFDRALKVGRLVRR